MATGKVNVSNNDVQSAQVNVSTLDDGTAFEFDNVIYIVNNIFMTTGKWYAFSICGHFVMSTDELVTPVDLEIKIIR